MSDESRKKETSFGRLYLNRLVFIACLLLIMILFHLFKGNRAVMNFAADYISYPVRTFLATLCAAIRWSVAEWFVVAAILAVVTFIVLLIFELIQKRKQIWPVLARYLTTAVSAVLVVAVLMALLWNVNYYADSFQDKSGIHAQQHSVDKLYETTAYFAHGVSQLAGQVVRDDQNCFTADIDEIFAHSKELYHNIEQEFPFLAGKDLRAKKVLLSRAMSYTQTSGVAFPFTGEANINIDQTPAMIPSTIAHEIAHQRRVASENEANFVAIVACDRSENTAYRYSGYLLAFIYLGNALAREDYDRYVSLYESLADGVKADLRAHSLYWRQFDGKVSEVSDNLYDGYLKAQGQEQGIKSYGAVVDLLLAYYTEPA
jgi:hypothetical protein